MMEISLYVQTMFLERMRTESYLGTYLRCVPWPVMIILLLPPVLFIAYCIWWKSKIKHLRTIPTSGCDNHLAMAVTIIYHLCRNQIVDANVLFFQLLRGMVKVHQMRDYGLFYIWTGMRPVVICFGADFFEAIMKSTVNLRKSFDYSFLRLWLKDGLVTSEGNKWKQRRKTITSTFHFRILEEFIPVFDEQSRIMIRKLEKYSAKECVDIVPYVTMCTLDIICETAMGISVHAQMDQDVPYLRAMHKVCESFVSRVMRPWLWPSWIFFSLPQGKAYKKNTAIMDKFTRQVIRDKKEALTSRPGVNELIKSDTDAIDKSKKKKAFLDLLLDLHLSDPLQFTEIDIQEEVDSFMFAGHDTTAVGISWALYLLGLYQEIQVKVQDEIQAVFGDDKSRPITEKDLRELKYLDCVIKETQRIYSPAPYIGRELLEDVKVNEITIPKGTTCMMLIYMLHRDEKTFPNPEIFNPDRFLPENCLNRHPFAFCPFSAGPRSCIGQKFAMLEEKTVIANCLRYFNVRSLDERDKLQLTAEMVLRSRKGIRMELIPRK